jgi:hypothetical protein
MDMVKTDVCKWCQDEFLLSALVYVASHVRMCRPCFDRLNARLVAKGQF